MGEESEPDHVFRVSFRGFGELFLKPQWTQAEQVAFNVEDLGKVDHRSARPVARLLVLLIDLGQHGGRLPRLLIAHPQFRQMGAFDVFVDVLGP